MSDITVSAFVSVRVVEIRVRVPDDNLRWEERKVVASVAVVTHGAGILVVASNPKIRLSEAVKLIARSIEPQAVETRWNFQGLDQGHYTPIHNS